MKIPSLIVKMVRLTAKAAFAPLPTGYCISEAIFSNSLKQLQATVGKGGTIRQCVENLIGNEEIIETTTQSDFSTSDY